MEITQNWFSANIPVWEKVLSEFKDKPIKAIEIGSFEGMSALWLCENILTHPDSHLDCVDPYEPYLEHMDPPLDMVKAKENFVKNTESVKDKLTLHVESSFDYMKNRTEKVDLIYVDGDHSARACLIDMVQSHLLLNLGGMIIVDDYLWAGMLEGVDVPKGAINAFMNFFAEQYSLVSIGYQVILKKNPLPSGI
jgi:predicted O-methyltransferase YrrM